MYYIELLSVFFFFLIFGTIFSPFLGGCLVISLVLFILGAIVVFFSLNFIWFLVAGLIIYTMGFIVKLYNWLKLPDYNGYVNRHPECKSDDSLCCYSCGSEKITTHGLLYNQSKLRYYLCNVCGTTLFRFKVL